MPPDNRVQGEEGASKELGEMDEIKLADEGMNRPETSTQSDDKMKTNDGPIRELTPEPPIPEKPPRRNWSISSKTSTTTDHQEIPNKEESPWLGSNEPPFVPAQIKKDGKKMKGLSMRYLVLITSVLALSSIMSNIVCFNFTVLCMPSTDEPINANHSYVGYSKHERTMLFSSVALGALFAVVPVSLAITRFGTRTVFFLAGLLSAGATLFIPFAARISFLLFLVFRFLQGISFAACMPIVGAITSTWSPLTQAGLFMSALTAFGQLSSVFSMPVSGHLCASSLGWSWVFYLHGGLALIIFTVWVLLYRNDPEDLSLVSKREMAEIRAGKESQTNLKQMAEAAEKHDTLCEGKDVPYLEILSTPSIWGVWMGALGDLIAVQLIHTFSPFYIKTVLEYSMEKTGWTSALPVLFQFLVKVLAGHSSDRIHGISETTKLRIFNSMALGVSAAFMVALAFLPKGNPTLGIILITLTTSMFGFNGGGFNKCAALVSRQYSHFVLANIQFLWCLAMLICPVLVGFLLEDGTMSEWRLVYLIHAGILLVTNGLFCLLATAKPATWTDRSITNASKKRQSMLNMT